MTKKKIKVIDEFVMSATLTIAQLLKQGVRVNVKKDDGEVTMTESNLFFSRDLLPADYDTREGREYSLTITRIK